MVHFTFVGDLATLAVILVALEPAFIVSAAGGLEVASSFANIGSLDHLAFVDCVTFLVLFAAEVEITSYVARPWAELKFTEPLKNFFG